MSERSRVSNDCCRIFDGNSLMEHNSVSPVHPELKGAQRRFLKAFASQCGVRVEKLELPLLYYSLPIWTASMAAVKDGPSFCANMQVKDIN
jgi:hypothetical protein